MPQPPEETTADDARGGDQSDARLARLERSLDDLSARLGEVERQLNTSSQTARRTEARPFGQGATPTTDAQAEERAPVEPRVGAWREATEETASAQSHAQPQVESHAASHADAHTESQARGAAEDESAAVEDYPFSVPHARVEESAGGASFASLLQSSSQSSSQTSTTVVRVRRDFESLVGGSWFNWLGIIAVTLGVGFFLKYAFDNQWIGATGRVLLGGAAGCAILALAERLRARGYRAYAHVLTGGGILILYLSVYAARAFYELVGVAAAFALMSAVTTTAVLLAVRHDARSIAVLGLIGGFATPVLLSTGVDRQLALFSYIAFLDAGVLACAYFKRWRVLDHLAFAATTLLFAGWWAVHYEPSKLWRTFLFLTLFFLMFSALALLHNIMRRRRASWLDLALVIANATLYFSTSYALLEDAHRDLLGAFALVVAIFYALLAYTARAYHREDRLLASAYVGAAATFVAIAIAIQFNQHWVTIGWAAEGLALTWLGLRTQERAPRYLALLAFTLAIEHWFAVDLQDFAFPNVESFVPLLNARAVSCAALVGALAATNHLYRRRAEAVDKDEREIIASVLVLAANALALTLLTVDVSDYFSRRAQNSPAASLDNTRQLALTLIWTLYAAFALAFGVARRLIVLRIGALLVLFCAAVKLLAVDAPYYESASHVLLFNQTFVAFAAVVAALAFAARTYARADWLDARERTPAAYLLIAAANVLAVVGLTLETAAYFDRSQSLVWANANAYADSASVVNNLESTKQLALTFVWSLYACVAFAVGVKRGRVHVRYGALALLALAGGKVIGFDARFYAAAWHAPIFNQTFAAFAVFVAAVWYVAHEYARAGNVEADERRGAITVLTVVGNLFAVAALSLEASGYFRKQLAERAAAGLNARDLRLARQLSLSLVWAVYGGALLFIGHARQNKTLRLMALALLAATTVKVFFFDLSELDKFYRIVSFIVLGLVLLAVSFLYQQRRAKEAEG
jgi:uncharacterized membrane protein